MGNDQSVLDDSMSPNKLEDRSLAAVAKFIKDGKAKKIVVMTGAGLSTAAGIPDFRSPGTGLYANLSRLNLPSAESVFDIDYFRENPNPFYVLAKELYPGNYKPTISHVFIALLAKKGLLRMLFTQNIDCLEREAGVPGHLIVEAHGSFATQRCIDCKQEYPNDAMKAHVVKGEVPRCVSRDTCNGLVKPDIVFFGESLPPAFFRSVPVLEDAELALVMGTSLSVHPFASLPDHVAYDCPRVLFNMERVGSFGTRPDDVLALGDCDANVCKLADELGWREDLSKLWHETVGEVEAQRQISGVRDRTDKMQDEMEQLTNRVGAGLTLEDKRGDDAVDQNGESKSSGDDEGIHSGTHSDHLDDTSRPASDAGDATLSSQVSGPDVDTNQKTPGVINPNTGSRETEADESPRNISTIQAERDGPSSGSRSTADTTKL